MSVADGVVEAGFTPTPETCVTGVMVTGTFTAVVSFDVDTETWDAAAVPGLATLSISSTTCCPADAEVGSVTVTELVPPPVTPALQKTKSPLPTLTL